MVDSTDRLRTAIVKVSACGSARERGRRVAPRVAWCYVCAQLPLSAHGADPRSRARVRGACAAQLELQRLLECDDLVNAAILVFANTQARGARCAARAARARAGEPRVLSGRP